MKTASLPNQSTSQIPSDSDPARTLPDPTQTLPDPSRTQRIAWTPPNTPARLTVTPGGGPVPDRHSRRYLLRGVAALLLTLCVLWRLPLPRPGATRAAVVPPVASPLVQQPAPLREPMPSPFPRRSAGTNGPIRVFLVAPSVPLPADD